MTPEQFALWLEAEARRIKDLREQLHGGTRNRMDLVTWADALQWSARKMREHGVTTEGP